MGVNSYYALLPQGFLAVANDFAMRYDDVVIGASDVVPKMEYVNLLQKNEKMNKQMYEMETAMRQVIRLVEENEEDDDEKENVAPSPFPLNIFVVERFKNCFSIKFVVKKDDGVENVCFLGMKCKCGFAAEYKWWDVLEDECDSEAMTSIEGENLLLSDAESASRRFNYSVVMARAKVLRDQHASCARPTGGSGKKRVMPRGW